ncbi:helix-turn-helix domain-containing protein [Streptococcus sp. V728]|uniref:helix-turn-helix domain-containing protein n=1 Tax=Streptococcus sp. V728 TaxID=3455700 RepID=UPI003F8E8527
MNYEQRLNDNQRKRFAFMLKQKRKDNKLSQEALGDILGYSQAYIYKWEACKIRPNLYQVEDVATYFNLPINVFIGEK